MPTKKKQSVRLAINGFGRIGRSAFKIALDRKDIEVVALNDIGDPQTLAHLLKYDTAYGRYDGKVRATRNAIYVNGKKYPVLHEHDPKKLPWKDIDVDVVLECTGRFVEDDAAYQHVKAGAKRVIISAPAKGDTDVKTHVLGVNETACKRSQQVISNASCTTNCIAPVVAIMDQAFGIKKAMMTTVHSYTAEQRIQDAPHKDLRRARAAAQNIVPTTTGAALATTQAMPKLKGKFDGIAVRVPTITVSLADFTFLLKKKVTVAQVNKRLKNASETKKYDGILGVTEEPVVSSDFIGDSRSSIVDLSLTNVVSGDMVKIVAWYDNEWGYSNRLVEMAAHIA